jgi:hypothetical protein
MIGKGMIGTQENERKRFVVAQQHVVGRAIALDQLRFEQQRLGFGIGRHDRHRPRLADHAAQAVGQAIDLGVIGHAVLQRARLAHIEHVSARIEHAIDARLGLQGAHHLADRFDAAFEVGWSLPRTVNVAASSWKRSVSRSGKVRSCGPCLPDKDCRPVWGEPERSPMVDPPRYCSRADCKLFFTVFAR